jgi:hypothetical protein
VPAVVSSNLKKDMTKIKALGLILPISKNPTFWYRFVTILFYIVFLAFTTFLSALMNIWIDESASLITTSKGIMDALNSAIHYEYQAPLYFIILWCWRQIDNSIFFGRLLSIIFAVASIELFRKRILNYVKDYKLVMLGIILFAFSPFLINSAVDIRKYSIVIFISIFVSFKFIDTYVNLEIQKTQRLIYICVASAGLYIDYYFGFLLLAQFITLVIFYDKRCFRKLILDSFIIFWLCMPLFYVLYNQLSVMQPGIEEKSNYLHCINLVITAIEYFVLPVNRIIENRIFRWLLRSIIILFMVYGGVKNKDLFASEYRDHRVYLVFASILLLLSIFFISKLSVENFLDYRHFTMLYGVLIFALILVCSIGEKQNILLYLFLILLVTLNFITIFSKNNILTKPGNFIFVANYLQKNEVADQPILIYPSYYEHGLKTYYRGINSVFPIKPISYEKTESNEEKYFAVLSGQEIISSKEEFKYYIEKIPISKEFWLVIYCSEGKDYHTNCEVIFDHLNEYNLLNRTTIEEGNERSITLFSVKNRNR